MRICCQNFDRDIEKMTNQQENGYPCLKQVVKATVVSQDGSRFEGTNFVRVKVSECPRKDLPTGMGYILCREICQQSAHAEINALALAGEKAQGALLYVEGHHYACSDCQEAARRAGIKQIIFGKPSNDKTT